jgi:hypothetical protein
MKLNLDPMPALRAVAVTNINAQFNVQAQPHVDAAHARKREIAIAGAPFPAEFSAEAELRGITDTAFAELILSKSANLDARELERQKKLAAIDTAKTPAELDLIIKGET